MKTPYTICGPLHQEVLTVERLSKPFSTTAPAYIPTTMRFGLIQTIRIISSMEMMGD